MKEFIADYGGNICAVIIAVISLLPDPQQSSSSLQKLNWKTISLVVFSIIAFVSSCVSTVSSNKDKEEAKGKIDSLNNGVKVASSKIDSIRTSQNNFERSLFKEFKIIRDSTNNLPKRSNTYNTTIGTAGTVNIGND
jgi:peptidoglycan hydrolase CwlO-like protein